MKRGFTLVETAVIIAIGLLILGVVITAFSGLGPTAALSGDAALVRSTLRRARSLTLDSRNDTQYGVHFEANRIVLFQGASYSVSDPNNVSIGLNSKVTISSITIQGGGNEVVFDRLTGATSEPGTTTVSLITTPTQKDDVIITSLGTVK